MSVTLRDVVLAVGYGDAALVGESAGYLILGAADCASTRAQYATLDAISLSEDGAVRLDGASADDDDAERSLRQLLGQLLRRVRIPSPNLERVAARSDTRGLVGLIGELEAALVPVNRRAACRTLARLCREAKKSQARSHEGMAVEEIIVPPPQRPAAAIEPAVASPVQPQSPAESAAPQLSPPPRASAGQPPAEALPPPPAEHAPAPAAEAGSQPQRVERGEHAEQIVAARKPFSRQPTEPAQSHHPALEVVAGAYVAQTPVEAYYGWDAPPRQSAPEPLLGYDAETVDDDDLDEIPTQVFGGVTAVETAAESSQAVVPAPPAPPKCRRAPVTRAWATRGFSDDESLIVASEGTRRRKPSDIDDLLNKMSIQPLSTDELYAGLKSLSRIERSPVVPPARAVRDDDRE